jgi:hypothetical protein
LADCFVVDELVAVAAVGVHVPEDFSIKVAIEMASQRGWNCTREWLLLPPGHAAWMLTMR